MERIEKRRVAEILVSDEIDIPMARLTAGKWARELGFNNLQSHCVITSVSELASNIYRHADSGSITINELIDLDLGRGIEVIARDRGRGIPDIELALTDGYSTENSLGSGLPGVHRLMGEIAITSSLGQGTVVRARKWLTDTAAVRVRLSQQKMKTRPPA